jgi:hypothetical protein
MQHRSIRQAVASLELRDLSHCSSKRNADTFDDREEEDVTIAWMRMVGARASLRAAIAL